jgi:hypothetical protein
VTRHPARLATLALVALAVAGCGKKGPPVAPELRLPVPPSGVSGFIDEGAIVITWTNPGTRLDGTPLRDLTEVRLFRREDADGAPLKPAMLSGSRIVGYDEIAAIRLDSPAPAVVQGTNIRWVDRHALVLGHRYVYVVTAMDSLARSSPPSERRAITFLAPPRPPSGVTAAPGDRQITLTWQAPAEFTDGSPVRGDVGYIVLRGTGGEGALSQLTPQPLAGTTYTDTGLENDSEYRYAVRSVRRDPRATVLGTASAAVAAIPGSTTPPSPPSNLVVVPSPGALRLAWNPSPEGTVAAYVIYRAVGSGPFIRVATAVVGNTTFVDRDVRPSTTYRYTVTAIDNARKPNESPRSNEVTITTAP